MILVCVGRSALVGGSAVLACPVVFVDRLAVLCCVLSVVAVRCRYVCGRSS